MEKKKFQFEICMTEVRVLNATKQTYGMCFCGRGDGNIETETEQMIWRCCTHESTSKHGA